MAQKRMVLHTVWSGCVDEYSGRAPMSMHPYAFCNRRVAEAFAQREEHLGADVVRVHPPLADFPRPRSLDDEIPF